MCRYALLQLLPDGGFVFVEYLSMFTFYVILKYGKGNDIGYTLMINFKSNHLFCLDFMTVWTFFSISHVLNLVLIIQ